MVALLRRPRWIVGTVLVLAISGACISAGFWQLRRLDDRLETNQRIRERSATTEDLPEVGFDEGADREALAFRRVTVRGTYDASREVLVRFRSRKGLPGYEVMTPLRSENGGGVVLVDRGWVPLRDGDRWPVPSMAPPSTEVSVTGLLAPAEQGAPRLADGGSGPPVVATIDPAKLATFVAGRGTPVYALHLLADDGVAGPGAVYPAPVEPPDLSQGSHRSYAVQWFLFASVGLVGWTLLLRRQVSSRASTASSNEDDFLN